jgi:siroheme synthase-like protein
MKFLPVGLDVREKRCVVVGGGAVGTRKVLNLLKAGASVAVVSPRASEQVASLAQEGAILWVREPFREAHLGGAFLAIAATDDPEVNGLLVGLAEEQGVLVCDASSSERSQVIFGALHRDEGATVAVFSDGEAPARARQTRDRIAKLLKMPGSRPASGSARLVLLAHGSRDPRWRASLEDLANSVRASTGDPGAALAFMQFAGPTLEEVVEDSRERGVARLRILPLFMASAGHVEKDVLPLVEELRNRYPGMELEVLTAVGEDPLFHRLIHDIVTPSQE